jgi:hypothetical protein
MSTHMRSSAPLAVTFSPELRARIEKLLRLTVNPNQHEAAVAAAKAWSLIEGHVNGVLRGDRPVSEPEPTSGSADWRLSRVGRCRSCGRDIAWTSTQHGKKMPVDLEPVNPASVAREAVVFRLEPIWEDGGPGALAVYVPAAARWQEPELYQCHLGTCPTGRRP